MYRIGSEGQRRPRTPELHGDPVEFYAAASAHAHAQHAADGRRPLADSDTEITVSWTAPDDGGSAITGYMVQSKYGDGEWMDVDPAHTGTDMMYMDTGLMPATMYYYRVRAMNAVDYGEWSDGMAMAMTEEAADAKLGNAMELAGAVGSEASTIELTWTAGDNADVHFVFGIQTPSYDVGSLVWEEADTSDSHTVNMMGKPSGSYMFFVIAGQTDDAGNTMWSAWTPGTVTY